MSSSALWLVGNAITSRMLLVSASNITMRSIPGAPPPCGGAHRARGRVELRNTFWVDYTEGMMHGIPASLVYVPLDHGEIDHASESQQIGIG